MRNTQLDSVFYDNLSWPYDLTTSEISDKPRLVEGSLNTFVTLGGKLTLRPGTLDPGVMGVLPTDYEPVRLYEYETIENDVSTPSKLYQLCSMRYTGIIATGPYKLFYREAGTLGAWTSVGSLRYVDESITPHEVVTQRGLAFVRFAPDVGTGEKYASVLLDFTGGTIRLRPWGLPAPTVPCRMSGRTALLAADITAGDLALNINTAYSPALTAPFTVQIDDERVRVTSIGGGTNWTITRGYDGTTATNHDAGAFVVYYDWAVSDHAVDVVNGWKYTYAWVSVTGHVSARAPLETNPDLMASVTMPFFDLVPKMTVQGHADTTNITKVNVYRTQDGGGTFFFVGQVTNTGAGDITFEDKYLETGPSSSVTNDPIPDDLLDTFNIAPSLTSNIVPPPVAAPYVIGTDYPQASTNLASYASRIWFGVRNYLYYSGNEEITEGVPEECFPTDNFFRFQYPITAVIAGKSSLFVLTTKHTYRITGTNRETFNVLPVLHNIGGYTANNILYYSSPYVRCGDRIAFMTQDRRICILSEDGRVETVSWPLANSFQFTGSANLGFTFEYWAERDRELLFVFMNKRDANVSRVFVYDFGLSQASPGRPAEPFWHSPWDLEGYCALTTRANATGDKALYFGNATAFFSFDLLGGTTFLDDGSPYDFIVRTHLMSVPAGNHVNELRKPGLVPGVARARVELTRVSGDRVPQFHFAYDDFWTDPQESPSVHEPTAREASLWYKTVLAEADRASYRTGLGISVYSAYTKIELHTITMTWNPEQGATE